MYFENFGEHPASSWNEPYSSKHAKEYVESLDIRDNGWFGPQSGFSGALGPDLGDSLCWIDVRFNPFLTSVGDSRSFSIRSSFLWILL